MIDVFLYVLDVFVCVVGMCLCVFDDIKGAMPLDPCVTGRASKLPLDPCHLCRRIAQLVQARPVHVGWRAQATDPFDRAAVSSFAAQNGSTIFAQTRRYFLKLQNAFLNVTVFIKTLRPRCDMEN